MFNRVRTIVLEKFKVSYQADNMQGKRPKY